MFNQIIAVVCEGEKLTFETLLGENRKEEVVFARQLIMYFAKTKELGSLEFIGSKFGKDHATVIHSVKAIKNYIKFNKEKRAKIEAYDAKINMVTKVIEVKEELIKLITPLQQEVSSLEQRLLIVRMSIDAILKEINY